MATADQYRQWMADNADKQGTESYAAIKEAYDIVAREEVDSGASTGPVRVTVPTASKYAAWLESNRGLEGTEDYATVQQALAMATEPVRTVELPPSESAELRPDITDPEQRLAAGLPQLPTPDTTVEGLAGAGVRGLAPTAAGALLGAALAAPTVVGVPVGAAIGATAAGLTQLVGDPIVMGINKLFGTSFTEPTTAMENLLTSIGVREGRTAAVRV
jgi:hypothetical protein